MTTTSLIALNAVLAALLVAVILRLLLHGIHSDRYDGATGVEPQAVGASERDRLAA